MPPPAATCTVRRRPNRGRATPTSATATRCRNLALALDPCTGEIEMRWYFHIAGGSHDMDLTVERILIDDDGK